MTTHSSNGYRDEATAARARIQELEDELLTLRETSADELRAARAQVATLEAQRQPEPAPGRTVPPEVSLRSKRIAALIVAVVFVLWLTSGLLLLCIR